MKNITIIGLGATGFSCVEFFLKKNMPLTVMDTRENPPKLSELKDRYPEVKIYLGKLLPEILAKTDLLVLSPGIAKDEPSITKFLKPKAEVVGDIELFARELKAPLVAITGSNGKSTVTTLVAEMAREAGLKTALCGNVGIPALTLLGQEYDLCVLELSSFQLETTESLKPAVATILNLSPDHMDRYSSVEDYFAAKERIYRHAQKIVANRDDARVWNHLPKNIPMISFGLNEPIEESSFGLLKKQQEEMIYRGKIPLLALSELKLFGRHNVANALAALALSEAVHIPLEACLAVLKRFAGLKHRCEWVRTIEEVHWINDSKGTNVGATEAAIQGLAQDIRGKWVLIAGGLGKNADFSPLKPLVQQHCRVVVLIGEASHELEKQFSDKVLCLHAKNMKDAVEIAAKTARPGDGVLLSPACASYDMFRNFEERGDVFRAQVMAL